MSLYGEHADRVNRIQRDIARAESDRIRRKGDLVGGTLAMLGRVPLEIMADRDRQRAAEQQAAQQAEKDAFARRKGEAELDELTDKRGERERTRAREDALAKAGTPFERAEVLSQFDPDKGAELHAKNRATAGRMLLSANPGNYATLLKTVRGLVGPAEAAGLPDMFPEKGALQSVAAAWAANPGDLFKPPAPPELMQGFDPNDPTKPMMVPKVEGGRPYVAPPAATDSGDFTLGPGAMRFDKTGKLIASVPTAAAAAGGGGASLSPAQKKLAEAVIANPAIYDSLTPTAKTDIAAELSARGFKFQTTAEKKPATGAQNKVLGFFNRAKQASDDLEQVEDAIAKRGLAGQTWDAWMPGFAQTDLGRQYEQSQRAFTEARLRKDSGAAIPETEFTNDRETYFVVPGDDEVTIDNKRRARYALLASMGFESGPALAGFYGDEADSMIEDYRARSKRKAANAPADAGKKTNPFR